MGQKIEKKKKSSLPTTCRYNMLQNIAKLCLDRTISFVYLKQFPIIFALEKLYNFIYQL